MVRRLCSNCDFSIQNDFGYSSYTTEGATVICSKSLNPHGEFDRWYGGDYRDLYAKKCEMFQVTEGGAQIDVDRDLMPVGADIKDPASWEPYATEFITAKRLVELLT